MSDLLRFNWRAFDPAAGIKVGVGLVVMIVLTSATGETWLATGFAAMLAWLTNVPGSLKHRIGGMLAFGVGAIAMTLVSGLMGLDLWLNVLAIAVVGLLGTYALSWGTRAYMVGWVVICWAIYGPLLVESTSVENCVLAILAGTGVVVVLNLVPALFGTADATTTQATSTEPKKDFVIAFSVTVALVLGLTTYLGWTLLKSDPTLVTGGAFFIIGFDMRTTWVAGFARVIAILTGALLGLAIASLLGPGLLLDAIAIAAAGLSFAAMAIHPGAWMFFFMIFAAIGWHGLEGDRFELTVWERLSGESVGVLIAMAALAYLQWQRNRRQS